MCIRVGTHDRGVWDLEDRVTTRNNPNQIQDANAPGGTRDAVFNTADEAAQYAARDAGAELIVKTEDENGVARYAVYDMQIDESGKTITDRDDAGNLSFERQLAQRYGGTEAYVSAENGQVSAVQGSNPPMQIQLRGSGYIGTAGAGGPRISARGQADDQHTQQITLRDGRNVYVNPNELRMATEGTGGIVDLGGNTGGAHATYQFSEVPF